jgi:predicted RNA-binding protein YlxR (DUF448 family)
VSAARRRPPGALDSKAARLPGPQRTCVGCRVQESQATLLRVVAVDGLLVVDPARRLPGRGASVHPDLRCVDLADKRRAFPRALRLPGPLDATPVREHLQSAPPVHPPDESRSTAP